MGPINVPGVKRGNVGVVGMLFANAVLGAAACGLSQPLVEACKQFTYTTKPASQSCLATSCEETRERRSKPPT